MTNSIFGCHIWGGEFSASGYLGTERVPTVVTDSARAGGGYEIEENVLTLLQELGEEQKARLTTALVDLRLQGIDRPSVTIDLIEDVKRRSPLPIHQRADRLLQYLVRLTPNVGDSVHLGHEKEQLWGAMAWTESTDSSEVFYFSTYLRGKGWIDEIGSGFSVLVEGFGQVADAVTNVDSSQAFVAMWFGDEMNAAYEQGIEPAIREAGYRPMRIDRKPDLNKIDDEIIAEIRRSRFLVSDFTHGKKGPRGGVYFEAGFAHGLNIPVIFTCRNDMVDQLHFDTRQYAHIVWETPEELRSELLNRIRARIGEGPELGRSA